MVDAYPDIVLSIGTGQFPQKPVPLTRASRKTVSNTGIFSNYRQLYQLARDHVQASLNSERVWKDHYQTISEPERFRYRRLNLVFNCERPELDDVVKMKSLQNDARDLLRDSSEVVRVAHQLVATSFYFDKLGKEIGTNSGTTILRGKFIG